MTSGSRRRLRLVAVAASLITGLAGVIATPRSAYAAGTGPWVYGTDLIAQSANATNGGATINGFSSATGEVAEECISGSTSACGRGEFGGYEPFGAVVLNNLDSANSGLTFGCPSTSTGNSVVAATKTGASAAPPAVSYFPGDFQGGTTGSPPSNTNLSGDNQCYSPYVSCSASMGTNNNGAGIN